MENNYYIVLDIKFKSRVKGLYGTFETRQTFHAKYMSMQSVDDMITMVKKFIKEDDAEIELQIDNLDWYGDPISYGRFLHDFNQYSFVTWPGALQRNYRDSDKATIELKEIKSAIFKFVDDFNNYIKEEQ